ncbi:acyl-CoA dehydrogenase family protein [Kitasatospora kifunensis]|uniref:Alkylation response protein AidB-like acyl-CoA dehydrogenase n=1 Tax=Kitasatospora kifunensis TaxID=58351 RepID=A0A7W7QWL6_KITKI|nr:acyl-CoA dehydrogenase family protein [Kitasatospora kifunensis]MBB4921092.1 alkylation response protein AidB-like acyl-CoA dehydrogenase [Kitasatospora kifunensis]
MQHVAHAPALLACRPPSEAAAQWLARAERLLPAVDADRDKAEVNRASSSEVFETLAELGLHRMWISRDLGGEQASLSAGMSVIELIARHDASVSWQIGVQGAIGRISDYLEEGSARAIFAEHDRLVVGSVHPTGHAQEVPGGYRLSGRWGFASGSAGAAWIVSAARVTRGQEATGETRMLFTPVSLVSILDTWHTTGLAATGSNDYEIHDVFVPVEHTVDGAALWAPPPQRASRGYAIGYYDFGPFTAAATVLGIAGQALDVFTELAASKIPSEGKVTLKNSHTVQDRLARARALLRSAHALTADAAWHAENFGQTGGDRLSALVRLACVTAAENATAVVDAVYEMAGATSAYRSHPLERCFRDVHTAAKHITLAPANYEMVGQYLLGGGLQARR